MSTLPPIVDWIGNAPLLHGERDDLDLEHPLACLCGAEYYLWCDGYIESGGLGGVIIGLDPDGSVYAEHPAVGLGSPEAQT